MTENVNGSTQQIDYTYDGLSRLIEADYDSGTTVYTYGYDEAGNLVNLDGTTRTFNDANQMTNDGTNTLTYDANGNLTNDGTNTLTWDRANRLLSIGTTSYEYDGLGNRVQQTVGSVVTDYLNDIQPGLTKLLRQSDGTTTEHFIHSPRGIHAVDDGTSWKWHVQDGLGSVRGLVNASGTLSNAVNYSPYGVPDATPLEWAFTGEQRDSNGLQFHRARYYAPSMGIFPSRDPFEGVQSRPMSYVVGELGFHNRYSYTGGNPVNRIDRNGMCWENATSSHMERHQCLGAWNQYESVVSDTHGASWSFDIANLMAQEERYWSNLPYPDFVSQWNGSRPPSSTGGENGYQQAATVAVGAAAITGPTPDDVLWLAGALCLYGIAVAVGTGTIALPQRPTYSFSVNFDWNTIERDVVATLTGTLAAGTPKILYRGTALSRANSRTGLEAGLLWLADNVAYATIYAHFDAQLERDTSAISIYAILQATLTALVASGNVQQRFQVEYGFDTTAQAALVGPVVIPIPDFFRG